MDKPNATQYGLLFDHPDPSHWTLGSSPLPFEILQSDGDWTPYLPTKEFQNKLGKESYACVIFTLLNCIEILIKRKYEEERNFADAFLAELAETRKNNGSSPQVVCELLRKMGVPQESDFPFDTWLNENAKITEAIYKIALEITKEFEIGHEFVELKEEAITLALTSSPLMISVYAWVKNDKGLYYRPEGTGDVHATTLIYQRAGEFRRVFDTYPDSEGDAIKDYDWNSMPMIVKRFTIERKKKVINISLWQRFWRWWRNERLIIRYLRRSLNK